ncbi:ABC transporter permease subunit [candidate division KSB3 bacterium]|uniref:ABC transporter permease subunit n=1 Tax=candidate division KSB3 bacterium TaxID=2044937 RepID=A0A9D5K180_9BACT|nr:ABC transporter permease subunit [candidate division KSB3 bacterium]MBD3327581.1 ABC transporter permease subunit [candidate division KSB3 bacterium]
MNPAGQSTLKRVLLILIAVIVFGIILFPPLMLFLTSIKTELDALSFPPKWIFTPTAKNYSEILKTSPLVGYGLNSLIVASVNTFACLVIGSLAAYGLARFRFRGSEDLAFWFLSVRMMPPVAAIIPIYVLMKNLRLLDTVWCLIIVYLTFNLPFVIWMLKGFFEEVPLEIQESALIDGCSEFGVFYRICLPLIAPGLAATAILAFIFAWNEFLFALILTGTRAVTLPVGIIGFMKETGINWGYMTAGGILALIPVILFTIFAQRHLVKGLTLGALK